MTDREQLADRLRKIAAKHHKLALQAIKQSEFHFEFVSEAERLLEKIKAEVKENA
jgi:hypothetical protein